MPTYQYRCQACTNELEAFQKFTDDALTVCPECGGKLRKLFNAVGIVFKGSGFYATDSRKSKSASTPSASAAAADSSASSSDSSTAASPTAASSSNSKETAAA